MTHLTYLIDNLLRAGTQTALGYLVEGLAVRGYRQRVVCLNERYDSGLVSELEARGAEVVVIRRSSLLTGSGWLNLYRLIRGTNILQTFLPFSDIIGRTMGRIARVPVIVTSIRARNIDKASWQLFLDRLTMRWADRVVFNSEAVVEFSVQSEGVQPDQVVVIPNGVRLRPEEAVNAEPLPDLPAGAPVLGMVGRLRPQKGVDVLLQAFALLDLGPQPQLLLIGDGELRTDLERLADSLGVSERVHFLGMRPDVPALYAEMDLYVHPSIFEGMPNAVMEAMAAGLPVIASAADGTRELISHGITGWLVPVGDTRALADAISDVLRSPAEKRAVGAAAASYMGETYSVEEMVRKFDRLYRELLSRKLD